MWCMFTVEGTLELLFFVAWPWLGMWYLISILAVSSW